MKENNEYTDIMMKKISDMNYCSNKYSDFFVKDNHVENIPKDQENMLINVLLEYKYKKEDGIKMNYSEKDLIKNYKETFDFMDLLSDKELEGICENRNKNTTVYNINQYTEEYKFQQNYNKTNIDGAVNTYCNNWITKKVSKNILKMKNEYDVPVFDEATANDLLKKISKELYKLDKEGY